MKTAAAHRRRTRRRTLTFTVFVPVIVAMISAAVSIYGAYQSNKEKSEESYRSFDTGFVNILNGSILDKTDVLRLSANSVFGLPAPQTVAQKQALALAEKRAIEKQSDAEARAAAYLFALDGLASTPNEHKTVLLIAARLLNLNSNRDDSGQPAARFLSVAVAEMINAIRNGEHVDDERALLSLVRSPDYLDLVTSGYFTRYYKDDWSPPHTDFEPTLTGDQSVPYPSKEDLLWEIGPSPPVQGWIHVASWEAKYALNTPARGHGCARGDPSTWSENVERGDKSCYKGLLYDYVATERPEELLSGKPTGMRLLSTRLLRDRPPTVFVSHDGTIMEGSLGRVIGDVPIASCVDFLEPAKTVLVFVNPQELLKKIRPGSSATEWNGMVHAWAHVTVSSKCSDGLPAASPGPYN